MSALLPLLLIGFVFSTVVALGQTPWPRPFEPMTWGQWFRYPYERNAFRRLPVVIVENLNAIIPVPGTNKLFAVGSGGMILEISNDGRCLRQRTFEGGPAVQEIACDEGWSFPSRAEAEVANDPSSKGFGDKSGGSPKSTAGNRDEPANQMQQQLPRPNLEAVEAVEVPPTARPTPRLRGTSAATVSAASTVPTPQPTMPGAVQNKPELRAGVFVDRDRGWIVGDRGTVLATKDGGATWAMQDVGTTDDFTGIAIVGDHGCIVGDKMILTDDGGASWKIAGGFIPREPAGEMFSVPAVRAVSYADQDHGWAVGPGGIFVTVDSGRTWRQQEVPETTRLHAVHFVDAQRGWAVGGGGTILGTSDGGLHWARQASQSKAELQSVSFSDPNAGIAVGDGGSALITDDGGRTWSQREADTSVDLGAAYAAKDGSKWAVGEVGTLLRAAAGRADMVAVTAGGRSIQRVAVQVDANHAWVGGHDGILLRTSDGGRAWQPVATGTTRAILSIAFYGSERGWAGGEGGTIIATRDGGETWSTQVTGTTDDIREIRFANESEGTIGTDRGGTLTTKDGGASWTVVDSGEGALVSKTHTFENGTAVRLAFNELQRTDGDGTWQDEREGEQWNDLLFLDERYGWTVGRGTVSRTIDGGRTWLDASIDTDVLYAAHFRDERRGWTVGNHVVADTKDGGASWSTKRLPGVIGLDVHFAEGGHGLIAGAGVTPLTSPNDGETWQAPVHTLVLAPWYWVFCSFLLAIGYVAVRRAEIPDDVPERVGDVLISDKPLTTRDPDALGIAEIANALARFLSNRSTQPPLTIAVTGAWGTGKSSLMNLLFEDLTERRFSPVWFNAWHHQKGEQLLASLFAHIKKQAVPPWLSRAGFGFRARLLYRRALRQKLAFAVLTVVAAVTLPLLFSQVARLVQALSDLQNGVRLHPEVWLSSLSSLASGDPGKATGFDTLLALLGGIPSLALVLRTVRGFGIDPAQLVAIGGTDSRRTAQLDPGARSRFAEEFEDVAASLDLGSMVIFIDDLDRCAPENVLEILETINFLSVSGRCFIVMGMARDWVETCVGLGFKDVADEWQSTRGATNANGSNARREFARQYLKKLINLEIPIPHVTADGLRHVLVPPEAIPPSRWEPIFRHAQGYAVGVAAAALIGLAWIAWTKFPSSEAKGSPMKDLAVLSNDWSIEQAPGAGALSRVDKAPKQSRPRAAPGADAETRRLALVLRGSPDRLASQDGIVIGKIGEGDAAAQLVVRYAETPSAADVVPATPMPGPTAGPRPKKDELDPAEVVPPDGNHSSWLSPMSSALVALVLLGLSVAAMIRRPVRFTRDSQSFRDALKVWAPWVYFASTTPRETKRFLNRLRYIAMRSTKEPSPTSFVESIWNRLRDAPAASEPVAPAVSEPALVALTAMHCVHGPLVSDPLTYAELGGANLGATIRRIIPPGREDEQIDLLRAIEEHKATFPGTWPPAMEARDLFLTALSEARS